MSNHIELKRKIVCHRLLEVGFGGNLVIEVIKGVEPFIIRFNGSFHTEPGFVFAATKPHIQQVLAFVFCAGRFLQTNMFADLVSVILEIDELASVVLVVRNPGSENGNTRVGADAVESVFIERYYTLKRVLLQNIGLDILFFGGLAGNRGLRNNHNAPGPLTKRIQKMLCETDFVQIWIGL